ncbi:MFS transporter [Streptomyces montanus]|uniref:MFS transporter n=1 Tax=Streptomyces montanus TaxID=2580423 RepID=A0A5R9FVW3_9ACTN|nr:MFS transporter [Streptomyces montanus]TLS43635.1 MFS transporter [Streptomyces montanus]
MRALTPLPYPPVQRSGAVLALLTATQFLVVLNTSVVNVALPAIGSDLGAGQAGLTWVVGAYVLAFGALLPVGGRLADLFGSRGVFLAGLALFAAGSLAASIPTGAGPLIAARAVQGVGAAAASPAALALLLAQSPPGRVRGRALGLWGVASAAGGAAGVLLGGVLTDALGWWSVFAVSAIATVPVLLSAPRLVPRDSRGRTGPLDLPGSLVMTAGLVLVVYGLGTRGGSTVLGVLLPAAGVFLLLNLVSIERRAKNPLIPPALLRNRSVMAGNLLMLPLGMVWLGTFFFLPLYQQKVLGHGPVTAGLTQLPLAAALMAASALAGRLRGTLVPGFVLLAGGLFWLARLPLDGAFLTDLLGPTVLIGLGLGLAFVPLTALGVTGVDVRHTGVAGGLVNTTRQVGGALGLAVLGSLAAPAAASAGAGPVALAHGYRRALVGAAVIAVLAAIGAGAHQRIDARAHQRIDARANTRTSKPIAEKEPS